MLNAQFSICESMKLLLIFSFTLLLAIPVFAQQPTRQFNQQPAKYVKQVSLDAQNKLVLTEKPAPGTALKFDISRYDMGSQQKTRMVFGPMAMMPVQLDYASKTATIRIPDQALSRPDFTLERMNKRFEMMSKQWESRAANIRAGKMPNGQPKPASAH
jgi:hypothetical protein